jgi:hypothetical protein
MAGEIYIADKATLDKVGKAVAIDATYANNLDTTTSDAATLIINITGKCQLLGAYNTDGSAERTLSIRIDGATNRIGVMVPTRGFVNLADFNIVANTSMYLSTNSNTDVKVFYRLLP